MAPEHVREIEERWPAVGAGVENGKQCLKVAIQVYRWNYVAAKLQQIVARVPPVMTNACGQALQCPRLARRSFPLPLERREFPLSQCPPPVHERACAKAGRPLWEAACHRGRGRFVPPRHACGASAKSLRYGGSPTSESHSRFNPLLGPISSGNNFVRTLSLGTGRNHTQNPAATYRGVIGSFALRSNRFPRKPRLENNPQHRTPNYIAPACHNPYSGSHFGPASNIS